MASGFVYLANPLTKKRVKIEAVSFDWKLAHFRERAYQITKIKPCDQDVIFMGQCLEDDGKSLHSYGVKNNLTIYVIKKAPSSTEEPLEDVDLEMLNKVLAYAIQNPLRKHSLKKALRDPQRIEKLIASTPGIKNDPVALGMLKDPELFWLISETVNIERIVKEHPYLAIVAQKAMADVTSDPSVSSQLLREAREEDIDYPGVDPAVLAPADMSVHGAAATQSSSTESNPSTSGQASDRQRISQTDLANALSFARMGLPQNIAAVNDADSSTGGQTSSANQEEALQQMRDMGIHDTALSRRALAVSGGNVEAAVNLIFEGAIQ